MLLFAVINDIWTRLCIAAVAIGKGLAHTHSFKFYIQHSKQSIRKQQCSHTNKKKGKFERKRINEENNAVSFYVMFPLLWRDWSLCYFNAQLPFSKSTWTNIQGQRCRSGRCSFLQQGSPEILILLIQCLLRWVIGNICQQLRDFICTTKARRSTASEWNPWTAHILATEDTTRTGYTVKGATKALISKFTGWSLLQLPKFCFWRKTRGWLPAALLFKWPRSCF